MEEQISDFATPFPDTIINALKESKRRKLAVYIDGLAIGRDLYYGESIVNISLATNFYYLQHCPVKEYG